jgi:hypothetical protein
MSAAGNGDAEPSGAQLAAYSEGLQMTTVVPESTQ